MMRSLRYVVPLFFALLLIPFASSQAGKKYTIKTGDAAPPKELAEPIAKLLAPGSVQLVDSSGKAVCDVWFRKEIPADATAAQIKTGVTFREVKQTEILGAVQFHVNWTDYRKQKVKPGVYTMRLAYQPTDGKHTSDVSDFQEFVLLISAKADQKTALLEVKALHEKSGDSLDLGHPAVFMLWPTKAPKQPELLPQPKDHWVVNSKSDIVVGGKVETSIGVGLTIVGHSPAE